MTRRKTIVTDSPADGALEDTRGPETGPETGPDTPVVPVLPDEADGPDPAPKPAARRNGVFGPLLGGMLAALMGFGLAQSNLLGLHPSDQTAALAALAEGEARLQADLAALTDRIATLEATPPAVPDLSRLDALDQRLQAVEALPQGGDGSTAALADRLSRLEAAMTTLPSGTGDPAEIDAALARLAELEAATKAQAAEAAAAATAAEQARALETLVAAIAAGSSFEAELAAVADPALQAALAPYAGGVTPLTDLQAAFPEAARAALQLARQSDGEDGWGSRLTDFLADQTGARSVTPREGDDPDAVLSRAEFALAEGRVPAALAELAALPPEIRAPLEGWITQATARAAVDAAIAGVL